MNAITLAPVNAATNTPGIHVRRDAPSGRFPEGRLYVLFVKPGTANPARRHTLPAELTIPGSLDDVLAAPFDGVTRASEVKRTLTRWSADLAKAAA
jgi:hypothetical protein